MNNWIVSTVVSLVSFALPVTSMAQAPTMSFQSVFTGSGPGGTVTLNYVGGVKGKAVTGRPFSATEEHHTLQVLGDGTRIDNKSSDKFYRDDQGRTRTEREDGTVLINDPVLGASVEFNGTGKMMKRFFDGKQAAEAKLMVREAKAFTYTVDTKGATTEDAAKADKLKAEAIAMAQATMGAAAAKAESHNEENLGFQMVNGVSAQGTRTTTSIPLGQIGNDRPIDVVSERWFSPELQMLIRSSNKDPRFGETTYELTNILQGAPDPALFQIPGCKLGESCNK